MDAAILSLVAPLLMKEFAIDLGTYRSGVQIALLVSIVGFICGRGGPVAACLLIPVILLALAGIIWFYSPEHARKELDAVSI